MCVCIHSYGCYVCYFFCVFVIKCVCLGVGFTILKSFILELQLCKCVKRWRWSESEKRTYTQYIIDSMSERYPEPKQAGGEDEEEVATEKKSKSKGKK